MPTLKLDHPHAATIELSGKSLEPSHAAAIDARRATADALNAPVGFPALSEAVVPDDRVALALGQGIPDLVAVAAGLIDATEFAGVETGRAVLVTADPADAELLEAARGHAIPAEVGIVRHDPADENELCWAGVTREDDQSILINRVLFEADLTLPVSCARPPGDRESRGAFGGLYPAFSSSECLKEYRNTAGTRHAWWSKRTEEIGWVVGAPLVVQVTPGGHGSVAAVVAGAPAEVTQACDQTAHEIWGRAPHADVDLVIATVSGEPGRQGWDDVARALLAAEAFAPHGAAIALCTSLRRPIGRSLARLRTEPDLDTAARKLSKDSDSDTWAAQEIVRSLQRGPLFLMSQLDPDAIEDAGIGPISSAEELQRLANRFPSVAVLEDAQHVIVQSAQGT